MKPPAGLLRHGFVTGLIGAAAVAVWFFVLDLYTGRPFRTPAALGAALFSNATSPENVTVSAGIVAAYTAVHLAAFWVAGIIFVALAHQVQRPSLMTLLTVMAAVALEAGVLVFLALRAGWVLGSLGVASVVFANLLAVASMSWYLWRTHPGFGTSRSQGVFTAP